MRLFIQASSARRNLGLVASRVWLWDDDGDIVTFELLDLKLLNGYMHGTLSADDCWLAMASSSPPDTEEQAISQEAGCLVLDGTSARIVGRRRRVTHRRRARLVCA
jgi:hypothetical protein